VILLNNILFIQRIRFDFILSNLPSKHNLSLNSFIQLLFFRTEDQPKLKQTKIDFSTTTNQPVSQHVVDQVVMNFVVESGQPFTIVDDPSFQKLISTLQPKRAVLSYRTLMSR
jgi:hypothetical protein